MYSLVIQNSLVKEVRSEGLSPQHHSRLEIEENSKIFNLWLARWLNTNSVSWRLGWDRERELERMLAYKGFWRSQVWDWHLCLSMTPCVYLFIVQDLVTWYHPVTAEDRKSRLEARRKEFVIYLAHQFLPRMLFEGCFFSFCLLAFSHTTELGTGRKYLCIPVV